MAAKSFSCGDCPAPGVREFMTLSKNLSSNYGAPPCRPCSRAQNPYVRLCTLRLLLAPSLGLALRASLRLFSPRVPRSGSPFRALS